MKEILLIALRALAGGLLVAAFAMLGDTLKPKLFAGLFSAAPSVAMASLLVIGLSSGPERDTKDAFGMIAGATGLVCYSTAAAFLVERLGAIPGSVLSWLAWVVPAFAVYWWLLR